MRRILRLIDENENTMGEYFVEASVYAELNPTVFKFKENYYTYYDTISESNNPVDISLYMITDFVNLDLGLLKSQFLHFAKGTFSFRVHNFGGGE